MRSWVPKQIGLTPRQHLTTTNYNRLNTILKYTTTLTTISEER